LFGYLLSGITLGIAAGLSPGPILTLVIGQTLRYGWCEGVKVSLAPLMTDLPIVSLSLLLLSRLAAVESVLAWLSLAGGLYVGWLGIESLRAREVERRGEAVPHSLRQAVAINFLNPHVYMFWMTVGGPLVLEGWRAGAARPAAFVAGFYLCLCGSKIALALLTNRSREVLAAAGYVAALRLVGLALLAFALWLAYDGLRALSRLAG
jgi:threonine/homoserine/homoserine lactone efflux protein